jgi:hypothetical protein
MERFPPLAELGGGSAAPREMIFVQVDGNTYTVPGTTNDYWVEFSNQTATATLNLPEATASSGGMTVTVVNLHATHPVNVGDTGRPVAGGDCRSKYVSVSWFDGNTEEWVYYWDLFEEQLPFSPDGAANSTIIGGGNGGHWKSTEGALPETNGGTGVANFNILSALAGRRLSQIIAPANNTGIQTIGSQNGMSVAGTPAIAMESDGQYISYTSAATSGTNNGWTGGSSSSIHPCGTNRDLRGEGVFVFKTGADVTNVRYYIGFTSNSGLLTNGPTVYHVAVFGYDTAVDGTAFWRVVTMDGVTQNRVVTTIPVATNTRYVFRVRLNSGNVEFFDDTSGWAASPTVTAQTANLPTSSQIMGTIMGNRTLANESKVIKCSSITVLSK